MIRKALSAAVLASVLAPAAASAAGGNFGAGLILGEPSGLSLKYFFNQQNAVDVGLSFSFNHDALYVHADYLWHFNNLGSGAHKFLPYVGIGGRVGVHGDGDHGGGAIGARVPLGIAWMPSAAPIDVFVEISPGVNVIPETYGYIGLGLGARFFF